MAKQPLTPTQQAQATIDAEQRAEAVAAALEALRNQLDPTRAVLAATTKSVGVMQSALGGLQSVASLAGTPTGAIAAVGGQLGKLAGMAGPWGQAVGAMISGVAHLPQLFKSAADSVNSYVSTFSPLASGRYAMAWKDLTAVIGEQLMPVLDAATSVVRFLGDTLGGLTPIIRPLIEDVLAEMKPLFVEIGRYGRDFVEIWVDVYQVFRPLIDVFGATGNTIRMFTGALKYLNDSVKVVLDTVYGFLGVQRMRFDGSSQGKAFVGTSTGSVSAFLGQQREKAYQLGGQTKNLPQEQVDILAAILKKLAGFSPEGFAVAIAVELQKTADGVSKQLETYISGLVKGAPELITAAISAALKGMPKAISDAIKAALPFGGGGGVPGAPMFPPLRF